MGKLGPDEYLEGLEFEADEEGMQDGLPWLCSARSQRGSTLPGAHFCLAGKPTIAQPVFDISISTASRWCQNWRRKEETTISKGAKIQFTSRLKATWIHNALAFIKLPSVSYRTLQRIGYIMTSSPTAIGTETFTAPKLPAVCKARDVEGT